MDADHHDGPIVGLALSGGAVRGAAQAGALSVLEEHEVPIHIVAGTSAGTTVGALYAAGVPPLEISNWIANFRWPTATKWAGRKRLGLFDMSPFAGHLSDMIGNATFEDLEKQLIVVTCDVVSGERVLITEGDVARAIQASSAIPGLFVPVRDGDRLLIDGGTVDNYPVTVPREFGADVVIGVDIGSRPGSHAPKNVVEMLVAAATVRQKSTGVRVVDVDIVPDVREFSSFEFEAVPEMYERGRRAAEEAMPDVEAMLGR
jgi:NTE family protein